MTLLPDIRDAAAELRGKRVLLRAELNVPFAPGTTDIADDSRIRATLPTLRLLRDAGARTIVCTHIGRPKGVQRDDLTVEPVRTRLSRLLEQDIAYAGIVGSADCERALAELRPGGVAILENLRFDAGEESDAREFASSLAALADVYVNDAFGASHRAHASIVGVPRLLARSYAGLLLTAENAALTWALKPIAGRSIAIVGGAKVADKLSLIRNLAARFGEVLTGGGLVGAFAEATAAESSGNRARSEEARAAAELLGDADVRAKIVVPDHVRFAADFAADAAFVDAPTAEPPANHPYILDLAEPSINDYVARITAAKKVVWNGPIGVFEWDNFARGTRAVAEAIASLGDADDAFTLAGGGSTAEAINAMGLHARFTHVSTGGGATLEFLEGKTLPGISALLR